MRVAAHELVSLQDASGNHLTLPIGDFPRAGKPRRNHDGVDVYDVPSGVTICSYDHDLGELRRETVTEFTVNHQHPCVRVTTRRRGHADVIDGEGLAIFDQATGQLVRMAPRDAIGKLLPFVKEQPWFGTEFDHELGWFYGVLVADGWVHGNLVGYAKVEDAKRGEFVRIAREKLSSDFKAHTFRENKRPDKYSASAKVHLYGKALRDKVFNCYAPRGDGRGALYKKVPDELFARGSRDCLLGLLAGLIDGDCSTVWSYSKGKPQAMVRFNTSSEFLVHDIQHLCRRFGIRTSVTKNKPKGNSTWSFVVLASTPDFVHVLNEFRCVGQEEQAFFKELAAKPPIADSLDIVPVAADLARQIASECSRAGESTRYACFRMASHRGHVGRSSAAKAIGVCQELAESPAFAQWVRVVKDTKVHWDFVKRVDAIEAQDVFDLAVPGTNAFALENGLIICDMHGPDMQGVISIRLPRSKGRQLARDKHSRAA